MVGKVRLEAQSATSTASAIAEVALRTTVFKISCALIELRFQFFCQLIAQFCSLILIMFYFGRNIDKFWPSLANDLLFFCLKSQKKSICIVL